MIPNSAGEKLPAYTRRSLSRLRSLLVLAELMMQSTSDQQIIQLACGAAKSLAPIESAFIELSSEPPTAGAIAPLAWAGGRLATLDESNTWAFPLSSGTEILGWLVGRCAKEPNEEEQFLMRALAQHTAGALSNRLLHEQERAAAAEAERANGELEQTLDALRSSIDVHARLTDVATSGKGQPGIAEAVHELTGLPVAIEDRFGNLTAWAGPDRPDPYPKQTRAQRERLMRRWFETGRPVRVDGRWIAFTRPQPDLVGALVLFDNAGDATDREFKAVEHGLTVLAIELNRLRSVAESELRVRRDLVDELLTGADEESALRRARALSYDLESPHRVVVIETGAGGVDEDGLLHAVRRVARRNEVGTLLTWRGSQIVLLAARDTDWDQLRRAILDEMNSGSCRIGVGEACVSVADFPKSLMQADTALRIQKATGWEERAVCYEDLGVFQLLAEISDPQVTKAYVDRWLAPLLEYDEKRNVGLVSTISRYFDCGGNYDATAASLFIHRSTLKYRLRRIRELTGYDLNDPETRFNLQFACRAWETLTALGR